MTTNDNQRQPIDDRIASLLRVKTHSWHVYRAIPTIMPDGQIVYRVVEDSLPEFHPESGDSRSQEGGEDDGSQPKR